MADKKISELTEQTTLEDANEFPLADSGATKKVTWANMRAQVLADATNATQAELDAHTGDTSAAHAASAISSVAAGSLAATDVQAALNELDTEKQPLDATLTALAAANWAANSVPVGTGADTLSQLSMAASTIFARLAAGNVVAATPAQIRTLLGLDDIAYVERTTNLSVTATTEVAAQEVVSAGAITYDGTAVWVEFSCPAIDLGTAAGLSLVLQDDTTVIGTIANIRAGTGLSAARMSVHRRVKITPSAASHTYKVTAFRSTADCTINAASGGSSAYLPTFIRVAKA